MNPREYQHLLAEKEYYLGQIERLQRKGDWRSLAEYTGPLEALEKTIADHFPQTSDPTQSSELSSSYGLPVSQETQQPEQPEQPQDLLRKELQQHREMENEIDALGRWLHKTHPSDPTYSEAVRRYQDLVNASTHAPLTGAETLSKISEGTPKDGSASQQLTYSSRLEHWMSFCNKLPYTTEEIDFEIGKKNIYGTQIDVVRFFHWGENGKIPITRGEVDRPKNQDKRPLEFSDADLARVGFPQLDMAFLRELKQNKSKEEARGLSVL